MVPAAGSAENPAYKRSIADVTVGEPTVIPRVTRRAALGEEVEVFVQRRFKWLVHHPEGNDGTAPYVHLRLVE